MSVIRNQSFIINNITKCSISKFSVYVVYILGEFMTAKYVMASVK